MALVLTDICERSAWKKHKDVLLGKRFTQSGYTDKGCKHEHSSQKNWRCGYFTPVDIFPNPDSKKGEKNEEYFFYCAELVPEEEYEHGNLKEDERIDILMETVEWLKTLARGGGK